MNGIHPFLIEDEILLFAEKTNSLYGLNNLGAFIWLGLENGLSPQEITQEVSSRFDIPLNSAVRDTQSFYQQISDIGRLSRDMSLDDPEIGLCDPVPNVHFGDANSAVGEIRIQLLSRIFLLRFNTMEALKEVKSIFPHLMESSDSTPNTMVDVIEEDGAYLAIKDDTVINKCNSIIELASLITYEITRIAYQSSEYLIAIHSGVIGTKDACVLLPGISGSGKSTLTAGLVARGFEYFTDEVAVIRKEPRSVQAMPTSIAVKEGSWVVLEDLYEEISQLPICIGANSKKVRYLIPDGKRIKLPDSPFKTVSHIIFPTYSADAETSLRTTSKVDAIKRIADAGYETNNAFSLQKVEELIDWILSVPCYTLDFSDLNEAVELISTQIDEPKT